MRLLVLSWLAAVPLIQQSQPASPLSATRMKLQAQHYGGGGRMRIPWQSGLLKRGHYVIDKNGPIAIVRAEREKASDDWVEQIQREKATFFVTDARSRCDAELYLCGFDDDGVSIIERWAFTHPKSTDASGAKVPLDKRPLPTIERSVVFKGSQLGTIQALEVDPEGRFVLALTFEEPTLYTIPLPTGAPRVLFDRKSLPEIVRMRAIHVLNHATEGRKYWLSSVWDPTTGPGIMPVSMMLTDSKNDGSFGDAPKLSTEFPNLDEVTHTASGYAKVWLPICP